MWFEEFGAFDKGFERLVWTLRESGRDAVRGSGGSRMRCSRTQPESMGPATTWPFGARCCSRPGFARPGAGTATRAGEDLDAFLRVILAGDTLIYNPSAMVRHYARRTMPEFKRQLFGYGSGMCSVILKQLIDGPRFSGPARVAFPSGYGAGRTRVRRRTSPRARTIRSDDSPGASGYLCAPLLYTLAVFDRTRQAQFLELCGGDVINQVRRADEGLAGQRYKLANGTPCPLDRRVGALQPDQAVEEGR